MPGDYWLVHSIYANLDPGFSFCSQRGSLSSFGLELKDDMVALSPEAFDSLVRAQGYADALAVLLACCTRLR